jgi:hypothetical protein
MCTKFDSVLGEFLHNLGACSDVMIEKQGGLTTTVLMKISKR